MHQIREADMLGMDEIAPKRTTIKGRNYTVLFEGQDPEGNIRPAILYMAMGNGGHYTYSSFVLEHQLHKLVTGAYLLYANLISIGYCTK